jgi:hypothetical protein
LLTFILDSVLMWFDWATGIEMKRLGPLDNRGVS